MSARAWRHFEIKVDGFDDPAIFVAPTRAKARYAAFLRFSDPWPCTFAEFQRISRVRLCGAPPVDGYDYVRRNYGVDVRHGDRVTLTGEGRDLEGKAATVVYPGPSTAHVHLVIDGKNYVSTVHPMNVRPQREAQP